MTHSDESIRQLTEAVNTLARVAAKNENRFRWFGMALICLTLLIFYMGFNMVTQVQANIIDSELESLGKRVYQVFQQIEQEIDKEEENVVSVLHDFKTLIHNAAILSTRAEKLTDQSSIAALEHWFVEFNQQVKQAGDTGIPGTLVDALVLVQRLKQDSDFLRSEGKHIDSLIHYELTNISRILGSELRIINTTMRTMVHAIGPTMGRMGTMTNSMPMMNMVPW